MSAATCFLKCKVKASVATLIASDLEPAATRITQCTDTCSCAFPGCLRRNLVSKYRSFIHHVVLCIGLRCHILYMSFKGIVSAGRSGLCRASKSSQPFRGPASFSRSAYGFSVSKLFWECGHAIPVNAGHVSGAPDSCNLDFAFGVYREQSELGSRVSFQHCPRDFLFFSPLQSICRCFPNRLPATLAARRATPSGRRFNQLSPGQC
jgi:hypothetical protein